VVSSSCSLILKFKGEKMGSRVCRVSAHSISDAWFQVVRAALEVGSDYPITRGSFVGHQRRELESLVLAIEAPGTRPFSPVLPRGMPPVADDESIRRHFEQYWLSPDKAENEEYTHGERIHPQLPPLIKMLRETPGTNQACIEVGRPEDIDLKNSPCLRLIDYKLRSGILSAHAYFRSWDIWAGLPFDLGGLQLLNEFISSEVGCQPGPLFVYSKGAHLYDYQWKMALQYAGYSLKDGSGSPRSLRRWGMGRRRRRGLLVFTGGMFSGKSDRLILKLENRTTVGGQKAQAFYPARDTRTHEGTITSNSGRAFPAKKVNNACEIQELVEEDTDLVAIDEAQFFDSDSGLVEVCQELMKDREVIVAGLDMDFRGGPFGLMPQILAIATEVVKLRALCVICGEDAEYSQRMVDGRPARRDDPIILVGGEEEGYEARCSDCFVRPS